MEETTGWINIWLISHNMKNTDNEHCSLSLSWCNQKVASSCWSSHVDAAWHAPPATTLLQTKWIRLVTYKIWWIWRPGWFLELFVKFLGSFLNSFYSAAVRTIVLLRKPLQSRSAVAMMDCNVWNFFFYASSGIQIIIARTNGFQQHIALWQEDQCFSLQPALIKNTLASINEL